MDIPIEDVQRLIGELMMQVAVLRKENEMLKMELKNANKSDKSGG